MAARLGYRWPLGLFALVVAAALLVLAASPATPGASASACKRWGDVEPTKLRTGEARKAILCLVNQERDKAGLPNLGRDRKLQKAAQRHNDHMDGTGCFDHECGGEAGLDSRLQGVGYLVGGLTRWAYGENIAWGTRSAGTPESIVDAWMHSAPHRDNILNKDFKEVGVGFSVGTPDGGHEPGGIYTTDFGLRVG